MHDITITGGDLMSRDVPAGQAFGLALAATRAAEAQLGRNAALTRLDAVVANPDEHADDGHFGALARALSSIRRRAARAYARRTEPAPWRSWCTEPEEGALSQMQHAMELPSAVRGALMPDAHRGYGLPIGGVLATEGTVVPYAVGVDIACRMKLTVLDMEPELLETDRRRFEQALLRRTVFGKGMVRNRADRADDPVLDADRWEWSQLTRGLRERAWSQLGTSGSGNHFVEFGTLELAEPDLGLPAGRYVALMSHSGSRGPGAMIANHYTKVARARHADLPPELTHLAWLDLDDDDGQAYWRSMELMGDYAAANHRVIHERVREHLGAELLADVENHHNFAWKEVHDGREVVVHRKGATPAGDGVLGVIPGSMATPAFVVRGRGSQASLESASHGAGRVMSRTQAKREFTWKDVRPRIREAGVTVLAAGIDENPFVYKDIHDVMAQQADLVDVVARFDPRVVRMADGGEPPED